MDVTLAVAELLYEAGETLEAYHKSFYDEHPEEEESPNETINPGASQVMAALTELQWPLIHVVTQLLSGEFISAEAQTTLELARRVMGLVEAALEEEIDLGEDAWRTGNRVQRKAHFTRALNLVETISCLVVKLNSELE